MYFGSPPFDQTELQPPVNLTAGCFGNETSLSECPLFDDAIDDSEEFIECLFAFVICQRMLIISNIAIMQKHSFF